jgi:hypothetical protein
MQHLHRQQPRILQYTGRRNYSQYPNVGTVGHVDHGLNGFIAPLEDYVGNMPYVTGHHNQSVPEWIFWSNGFIYVGGRIIHAVGLAVTHMVDIEVMLVNPQYIQEELRLDRESVIPTKLQILEGFVLAARRKRQEIWEKAIVQRLNQVEIEEMLNGKASD